MQAAGEDPISRAQADLASGSASGHDTAINALVAACGDPRAAATINRTIVQHPQAKARAWAAFQAAKCHDAQTTASLITALDGDADATVRKNAADALGKLADGAARGALEKAAADPDPDVRGAAGRALAKLP
jgi:HEAT repeat protein